MPKQTSPSQVLYPVRPQGTEALEHSQFTQTQWNFQAVAIDTDAVELTNIATGEAVARPCNEKEVREAIKGTLDSFIVKPISEVTMHEIIEALEKKCTELYNAGRCNECPESDGEINGYCSFEGCHLSPYRWCEYDD